MPQKSFTIAVFSAKKYDRKFFKNCSDKRDDIDVIFHEVSLTSSTAKLAEGAQAACIFVNDTANKEVLEALHSVGVRAVLLRCAGYNNVDLDAAKELGLFVANVPSYSPEAVAEYAVALVQTINRKTHRAYNRIREGNFDLEGLLGFTVHGKTVGVIGTGRIGLAFSRIMKGYGCKVIAYDPYGQDEFKQYGEFVSLEDLLAQSDIISLHCPLLDSTRHVINAKTLSQMKKGALLVNTSRGGLIDTKAVIDALKSKQLGALALDVYDNEGSLFYADHSDEIIDDDVFLRLSTFPNVLISGHQAFFTVEALTEIAECTFRNIDNHMKGEECQNALVKGSDSAPVRLV